MINNMQKKEYQRPTVDVVELKQQQHLLAGSVTAEFEDYQDGAFSWDELAREDDFQDFDLDE